MKNKTETVIPAENNMVKKAKKKKTGMWSQAMVRLWHDKLAMVGVIGLLVLILLSIFAKWIAPYSPTEMDLKAINQTPSLNHLFGTDSLGRDILSRLMYGGGYSLAIGFLSSVVAQVVALGLGMTAGYFGGRVDNLIMRIMDVIQAIPSTMISIVVALLIENNFLGTILALGLGGAAHGVRMTRSLVLTVRKEEYLLAAQAINCKTPRILIRHVMPNIMSVTIITMATSVGSMIMMAANLSVIGLGIQPPTPEWGAMLSAGRDHITHYPHLVIFPGLVIFACVFFFNLLGDGLRDAIDPKLRK